MNIRDLVNTYLNEKHQVEELNNAMMNRARQGLDYKTERQEMTRAQKKMHTSYDAIKDYIAERIRAWAGLCGTSVNVRFDRLEVFNESLRWYQISIYNNKGGIKPSGWLNKVTLVNEWQRAYRGAPVPQLPRIIHKARTDEVFLSPFDTNARDFVVGLFAELNKKLRE